MKEVKATCTSKGTTAGVICAHGCGYVFSGYEEIPMLEHTFVNHVCTGCGEIDTATLATLSVDDLTLSEAYGDYLEIGTFYLLDFNEINTTNDFKIEIVKTTCEHDVSDNVSGYLEVSGEPTDDCLDLSSYSVSCWEYLDEMHSKAKDCNGRVYDLLSNDNYLYYTNQHKCCKTLYLTERYLIMYYVENPYYKDVITGEIIWSGVLSIVNSGVQKITFGNAA